jgi:hypothetical protein
VIRVPGSAPLPRQRSHASIASKFSSIDAPAAAWASWTSALTAMSAPWSGPVCDAAAPKPPAPKNASNRSEIEPKPSKFGPMPPERSPSCP